MNEMQTLWIPGFWNCGLHYRAVTLLQITGKDHSLKQVHKKPTYPALLFWQEMKQRLQLDNKMLFCCCFSEVFTAIRHSFLLNSSISFMHCAPHDHQQRTEKPHLLGIYIKLSSQKDWSAAFKTDRHDNKQPLGSCVSGENSTGSLTDLCLYYHTADGR